MRPSLRLLIVTLLWYGGLAEAAVYGLVVGINDYQHQEKLRGAVNDARAIAQALHALGARQVVLLEDRKASRAAITAAWKQLVENMRAPEDILVFAFAGHGTQEPAQVDKTEVDGKDEVLVLADFHAQQRPQERLVDDELRAWFQAAAPRRILFVADACYSGTLTRSVHRPVPTRSIPEYGPMTRERLPLPDAKAAQQREEDLPHVLFLSAGRENEKTPEILLDTQFHGALSWAFARALGGAAGADGQGMLTFDILTRFVRTEVYKLTEYRQHPEIHPSVATAVPLLSLRAAGVAQPTKELATAPEVLRLHITGVALPQARAWQQQLRQQQPAESAETAHLVWDGAHGVVLSSHGDIVAYLPANTPEAMQHVLDKWAALRAVYALSEGHGVSLQLGPDDSLHRQGKQVWSTLVGHQYPYLTLVNLGADGTVQYLFPIAGDTPEIPPGQPFQLQDIQVQPPFGADHLVAVVSPRPLAALQEALQALDDKPRARDFAAVLRQHVQGTAYQLGVVGLYTAPAH